MGVHPPQNGYDPSPSDYLHRQKAPTHVRSSVIFAWLHDIAQQKVRVVQHGKAELSQEL